MSPNFFLKKSTIYFQIVGATRVTWSNFKTENQIFRYELCTTLFPGAFLSVRVNCYMLLYIRKKTTLIIVQLLRAIAQNLPACATVRPGFVQNQTREH